MYQFRTRDELEKFIQEEVCTGTEAQELLGITRQGIHDLVTRLKLYPILQRGQVTIFWKSDILQRKRDISKE